MILDPRRNASLVQRLSSWCQLPWTNRLRQSAPSVLEPRPLSRASRPCLVGMTLRVDEFPEAALQQPRLPFRRSLVTEEGMNALLLAAAPRFERRDQLPVQYLARYTEHVLECVRQGRDREVRAAFAVTEHCLREGNEFVVDLVSVHLLESLHNLASWDECGTQSLCRFMDHGTLRVWRLLAWLFRSGRALPELPLDEIDRVDEAIFGIAGELRSH